MSNTRFNLLMDKFKNLFVYLFVFFLLIATFLKRNTIYSTMLQYHIVFTICIILSVVCILFYIMNKSKINKFSSDNNFSFYLFVMSFLLFFLYLFIQYYWGLFIYRLCFSFEFVNPLLHMYSNFKYFIIYLIFFLKNKYRNGSQRDARPVWKYISHPQWQ